VAQLCVAARTREDQTRPYVVVDWEFEQSLIILTIRNVGQTIARNIDLKFPTPLKSATWGDRDFDSMAALRDGIPSLAPGQVLRIHFDTFTGHKSSGLPMRYKAIAGYDGIRGRRHDEEFILDLSTYEEAAYAPKGLPDLVKQVEAIRKELHSWRDSSHGGLAVTTADKRGEVLRDQRPYILTKDFHTLRYHGPLKLMRRWINRFRRRHQLYIDQEHFPPNMWAQGDENPGSGFGLGG
jgi:hypothetical protein